MKLKRFVNCFGFCLLISFLLSFTATKAVAIGTAGFDLSRPDENYPKKLVDDYFKFQLKPGETATNKFIVKNVTKDKTVSVYIYAADGKPNPSGGITFRSKDEPKKGLARWFKLSANQATLTPGQRQTVTFRLKLPNWAPKEEAFAGLVVEDAKPRKVQTNQQFKLNILQRAALLVIQKVPGPTLKVLTISNFSRHWQQQKVVFNLKLKNKGNVHLRPRTRIKIYSFGRLYDQIKLKRTSLVFPKQTASLAIIWPQTPSFGLYKAVSFVQYDKDKIAKKQLYLVIVPWWMLLLLFGLIFLRLRQRYRQRGSLQTVAQQETSLTVALDDISLTQPATEQQNKDLNKEISLQSTKVKSQTAVKEKKLPEQRRANPKKKNRKLPQQKNKSQNVLLLKLLKKKNKHTSCAALHNFLQKASSLLIL